MRVDVVEILNRPITLELARAHLRLGDDRSSDELLKAKIDMAISIAEDMIHRPIQHKRMIISYTYNSADDVLRLPSPTSELLKISYIDNGNEITVKDNDFTHYHSSVEDILFVVNEKFVGKVITIEFLCGYDIEKIPPAMKAAILLILGTIYDNESNDVIGRITSQLSITAEKILEKYRVSPYV